MDKLGIFHVNQTSMCIDPHFKPSSNFLTDSSKAVFLSWVFFVIVFVFTIL